MAGNPGFGKFSQAAIDTLPAIYDYGPVFPLVPPPQTGWSWVAQSAETATFSGGILSVYGPPRTGSGALYLQPLPPKPYYIDVCFSVLQQYVNFNNNGICWYDGATGKFVDMEYNEVLGLRITKWNSVTSYNAAYATLTSLWRGPIFARFYDDVTTRKMYYSWDGISWILLHSVATNDFVTPTHAGVWIQPNNNTWASIVTVYSWNPVHF